MLAQLWWRLIRFGFHLLYNQLAFTYDLVSHVVSLGAWRCWQRAALPHLNVHPGAWILELAHGTGNLQLDMAQSGYQIVGYDLSPYMGRIAQNKLWRFQFPSRLIRGKAQQLPFPSGLFAAVVSTFPTNFIAEDDTVCEIYRVLQPGGRLVIVPTATFTRGATPEAALEWLYRVTGQRGGSIHDVLAFFERFGFDASIVNKPCPRSTVQVIVALKRG